MNQIELDKALDKLNDLEDAEEEGRLVLLPCAVGDTVYVIYQGYVTSAEVLAFYIDRLGGMFDLKIKTNKETTVGFETIIDTDNYTFEEIGQTVFLTHEEAEKAIREREKRCLKRQTREKEIIKN